MHERPQTAHRVDFIPVLRSTVLPLTSPTLESYPPLLFPIPTPASAWTPPCSILFFLTCCCSFSCVVIAALTQQRAHRATRRHERGMFYSIFSYFLFLLFSLTPTNAIDSKRLFRSPTHNARVSTPSAHVRPTSVSAIHIRFPALHFHALHTGGCEAHRWNSRWASDADVSNGQPARCLVMFSRRLPFGFQMTPIVSRRT